MSNEIAIRNMLKDVASISAKYDLVAKETGGYFNVFQIADIYSDEVKICRVLCELLSPTGSHHQGIMYLKPFIKNVLRIDDISDDSLQTATVKREYVVENNRRIDIVVEVQGRFIPIEVKIYAGDQPAQCSDYLKHARGADLYYLTLYGNPPSEISNSASELERIQSISFETDILNWLNECISQPQTIKIAPIREMLLQFAAVIRLLTNQTEERESMEVKKILSASPESIKNAEIIAGALNSCKTDMVHKLLKAIEDGVGRDKLKLHTDYEIDNGKPVKDYYRNKKSTWPSINYHFKNVRQSVDIWFRVEIDNHLWCGLCVAVNNENNGWVLTKEEGFKHNIEQEPNDTWWSTKWSYLPNENECPNFKQSNDAFYNLFDEQSFSGFVNKCVKEINDLWSVWEKDCAD